MLNSKNLSQIESGHKVLFILTGSIACYKACSLISGLVQSGCQVQTVATASALKFVGAATLEGLTGRPVVTDLFETGHAMDHIHLVREADLILVAPATAHYINRCAQGVGDDLATTLFLAHDFKKPWLLAPAMNTSMYLHPVTQKSLQSLKSWGVDVLETASGVLACGERGEGKLLDPGLIFQEISRHLSSKVAKSEALVDSKALNGEVSRKDTSSSPAESEHKFITRNFQYPPRILITAGGMEEKIDDVRSLTNKSSGRTGYQMAKVFSELGFDVTLFLSENSPFHKELGTNWKIEKFLNFESLEKLLRTELQNRDFDWCFHAAAVSDFRLASIQSGKISSKSDLTLQLQRNPKLLNQIKKWSKASLKLVGFKLTSNSSTTEILSKVGRQFQEAHCDWVVHNDLSEMSFEKKRHPYHVHSQELQKIDCENLTELIQFFISQIDLNWRQRQENNSGELYDSLS